MYIYCFILAVLFFTECQAQCQGNTCGECISTHYNCAWCKKTNFTANRCQSKGLLLTSGCEDALIDSPQPSLITTENEMVRDSSSQNDNAVQIQPQRVKINTRPRAEHKLTMTFRAANNFPIDIYFLFDNSYSMKDQIKNLAALANDIGQSISTISTNYLMGYGIFQDKVALPFTDTNYEKVKNPCRSQGIICAPPFEFKHILNMTKNIKEFKEQVEKTEVTGNIDFPEGSIDALVQAIACKSIGWRDVGRKLLIFASNDRFHLAGDGRLAGIAIPNDGKCHLDGAGKYTKELQHDYPSVSQLTDIAEKNEVHIIFAVTQDQVDLFKQLSKRISQSKVERLYNPSDAGRDNIKDIIETKYKEMVSEVEIVHTPVKGVDLKIKAISDICEKKGTNQCKGLSIGTSIRFDVEVIVTECPSNPQDRKKEITIYPESMSNDKLVLDIEIVCECECNDDQTTWEINSNICNAGNGTLKCGICDCHKDRFGKFCECDSSELGSSNSGCVRPGVNSTVQCSGSGTCECGVCKCFEGFSGTHCECNDKACGNFRREICGGTNGRCVCGNCVCQSEYYGNACECPKSNTSCIYDEKVCNNAGTCECGECKCTIAGYTGKQCENCVLCGDTVCESTNYRRCAECAFLKKDKDCFKDCPETSLVTTLENVQGSAVCSIKQDDGCFLFFRVTSTASQADVTILVQKTSTCPEPVNVVPIALGVVGGVVAVGLLLLLLWKILTTAFDRIEYSRFQDDLKNCKWAQEENPFYKGATTTYKNPMLEMNEATGSSK